MDKMLIPKKSLQIKHYCHLEIAIQLMSTRKILQFIYIKIKAMTIVALYLQFTMI